MKHLFFPTKIQKKDQSNFNPLRKHRIIPVFKQHSINLKITFEANLKTDPNQANNIVESQTDLKR